MKQFVLVLAFAVSLLPHELFSQGGAKVKITATGTGNTTGHIANLMVHNMEKNDIRINTQSVYIPSDGRYQPYITTIPETTIPPGVTIIPLDGYCANVTTPPVPPGDGMLPVDDWISIDPVTRPGPDLIDIVDQKVPRFTIESIPGITVSTIYTPKPPPTIPGIVLTWPGTDIIVGGVLDPDKDPKTTGPVLIEALQNIAKAYDKLRGEGVINTPFTGDPPRERESVIQQTFWFYAAGLSGKRYQKEDFNNRVIEQYERNSEVTVTPMPEPDKKILDEGVDAFWNTFMATGTEAKVLRVPDKTTSANTVPVQDSPDDSEEDEKPEDRKCICDTISMNLVIRHIHEGKIVTDVDEPVTLTKETDELKRTIQNVDNDEKLTFTLSDVQAKCSCSYGEVDCQDYGSRNESGKLGNSDEVKIKTDNAKNCGVEEKPDEFAGTSFSFVIKSKSKKKDHKDGVSIDIIVTAHCKSDECNKHRSDKCEKTITIRLTKPAN